MNVKSRRCQDELGIFAHVREETAERHVLLGPRAPLRSI